MTDVTKSPHGEHHATKCIGKGSLEWDRRPKDTHTFGYVIDLHPDYPKIISIIEFADRRIKSSGVLDFLAPSSGKSRVYITLTKHPIDPMMALALNVELSDDHANGNNRAIIGKLVEIAEEIETLYFPEWKALRK
jgi:hypothetical protein